MKSKNLSARRIRHLTNVAREVRKDIVRMSARANASHVGSALSVVEILVALYFMVLRIRPKEPKWEKRDRCILSKGHGGASLYTTLAHRGFFSKKVLETFCFDGSKLPTHPIKDNLPGIEATTGSLGHGLPIGLGIALGTRGGHRQPRTFVVVSDGECDEGSVWEAVLCAGAKQVDNLVLIVDYNKIQSYGRTKEVLDLEPFVDKLRAFRWCVTEVDGHDFAAIMCATTHAQEHGGMPHAIIAHTIKGKGVSFMEDKLEWHYRSPTGDLLPLALKELDAS